jgi:polysaccharide biosynthesis protein PslH
VRPRILFLSQALPYPPDSGVTRRTFNILMQLQKEFDVTAICYSRRNHQPRTGDVSTAQRELAARLSAVAEPVRIADEWSAPRRLLNLALSHATGKPYVFFQYQTKAYGENVALAVARSRPHIVHLDSLDLYQWLDVIPPDVMVTCTHHDIESRLLARRGESVGNPLKARVFLRQSRLYEQIEKDLSPRVAMNLVMSKLDEDYLKTLAPQATVAVVPNGVDVAEFRTSDTTAAFRGPTVLFMGPTYMDANRDAVEYFVQEIWPGVLRKVPAARFVLIGRTPPDLDRQLREMPGVEVRGYVDDVRPHIAEANCFAVPIRVGGGTRLKILEGWAMGVPVVSTSIGCEGLAAVHGDNILIADQAPEFTDYVVEMLASPSAMSSIGAAGRRTVETQYSWDRIGHDLRGLYRELL